MANEQRWQGHERFRGWGGERSRYEGFRSEDDHGAQERGDPWRGAYGQAGPDDRPPLARGDHAMATGQHRGRGPKGYSRPDERIREDVNDRLTDDGELDASDIEVSVQRCEVTLDGTVRTRGDKRRAEDLADAVSGVMHVQNNLRVQPTENRETGLGVGDATNYPQGTVRTGNLARE